jgi:hypothetical protein
MVQNTQDKFSRIIQKCQEKGKPLGDVRLITGSFNCVTQTWYLIKYKVPKFNKNYMTCLL